MRQFSSSKEIDIRGLWLVVISIAWMAGIVLDRYVLVPAMFMLVGAVAALVALIIWWRDQRARLLLLLALWLLLGAWRYAIASPVNDPHAISAYIGSGKVAIQGSVAEQPEDDLRSTIIYISVSSVSTDGGNTWQNAHGQIEAQTLGSTLADPYGPTYGDSVEAQGTLQAPWSSSPPETLATMAFPTISINSGEGNPILETIAKVRIRLAEIIEQALPQPEASLLIAILLSLHTPALKLPAMTFGWSRTTPLISAAFADTGTVHLITASGYKVILLAGLVMASTRWLYEIPGVELWRMLPAQRARAQQRRWISMALTVACIILYTLLNGAGPAALRAGIMGILMVTAPRIGRIYNVYTALAGCALLMSAFDPMLLWNVSFQLTFLGTLGVVMLTPLFQRLPGSLERLPLGRPAVEIMAVTLAAQTATWPIVALTFNQAEPISPIANLLTVPLLSMIFLLGMLLCILGLFSIPAAIICGWIMWPLLWYVLAVVSWCAALPYAYLTVTNLSTDISWAYYVALALIVSFIFYRWPYLRQRDHHRTSPTARRIWLALQVGAALVILLATARGIALASRPNGQLTITFLSVGPIGQQPQGEAILIHTPDGKYALIDGGPDATSLAQELDSRLPPWQRSLDVVVLTSPRTDHLTGLQDVVTRYQIGAAFDAGMLHPDASYALWRSTLNARNIPYTQLREGMTITIGSQVALQVFWPQAQLHSGSDAEIDNGLIVRLVAPGLSMLLLGAASMSKYALEGLLSAISPTYLQANIVQLMAENGKAFPSQLSDVLTAVHPSLLIVSPWALSGKQRKAGVSTALTTLPSPLNNPSWQVLQTAQTGTIEIDDNGQSWGIPGQ
jgi:competence protein ComEC